MDAAEDMLRLELRRRAELTTAVMTHSAEFGQTEAAGGRRALMLSPGIPVACFRECLGCSLRVSPASSSSRRDS
jgi:hypothetical protein